MKIHVFIVLTTGLSLNRFSKCHSPSKTDLLPMKLNHVCEWAALSDLPIFAIPRKCQPIAMIKIENYILK